MLKILITLCFGFFLSRSLKSSITQKVQERDEKCLLLFKADEIAFDMNNVVSMESP